MVRTASAAAVLLFAAGLASTASAQAPETVIPPAVAVPMAAAPLSTAPAAQLPSIKEAMQTQATADAPPAPPAPPPPAPTASPSVAVAIAPLAPAARTVKFAFASPPPGAVKAAKDAVAARAEPAPMKLAVAIPVVTPKVEAAAAPAVKAEAAPLLPPAPAPVLAKVAVVAPVVSPLAPPMAQPKAELAVVAVPAVAKVVAVAPVASKAPVAAGAPAGANAFVAHRVTDAAGAFDAWTEKAARIDGRFVDAAGVSAALTDASAVQADQLEEGAVAFGALAALQDPVFVQSAKELANMGGDHDAAAAILLKTPAEVMALAGADGAAAFAAQALSKRALAVTEAGKSVRKAAYSMQVDPWALKAVSTPDKRLADAKARSATVVSLDGAASGLLMQRLVELRTSRQTVALTPGAPTPLVTRSLALAAMIVLGEADEAHAAKLTPLLVEAKSSDCLKMAKLNFFQCLSVAGPHYEDAFCIGQHGLGETAQCLVSATGVTVVAPAVAAPVLMAVAAPAPSVGVSVPLALLAEGGPERSAAFEAKPVAAPVLAVAAATEPATRAPTLLAELATPAVAAPKVAPSVDQPSWAPEPAPQALGRAYARQEQQAEQEAAPRYDRNRAYIWDRQTRSADYATPSYGPAPYAAYADPRQAYGRYAQPARPAYDPRYDDADSDDAPAAPAARAYPPRGYWNDR